MLSLGFEEGDYVMIGEDIKIHFNFKVSGDTLSVSVQAPKERVILRSALYAGRLAKLAENGDEQAKIQYTEIMKEQNKLRGGRVGFSKERTSEELELISRVHAMVTQDRQAAVSNSKKSGVM